MKLAAWLELAGVSVADFAAEVETTGATIYRYMSADRFPSREMMRRIAAATAGAVMPEDFCDLDDLGLAPRIGVRRRRSRRSWAAA